MVNKSISFLIFVTFFVLIVLAGYSLIPTHREISECPIEPANISMVPEMVFYANGFLVFSDGRKTLFKGTEEYLVGYPMAYPLEWGFVGINDSKLHACTYSGEHLWDYSLTSEEFNASPTVEYLFLFVPARTPPGVKGNDSLYVFGKTGLLEEYDFTNIYHPSRCSLLKSRGNHTLFLLNQPQADGSAGMGRVVLFKGLNVLFNRTFTFRDSIEDPVYCVGDVSHEGLAAFGLYRGVGIINGSFRYVELPPYGADDIAIAGKSVFALVHRETQNFSVVKELLLLEKIPRPILGNLRGEVGLFSSKETLFLVDWTGKKVYVFSPTGELLKVIEYRGELIVGGEKLFLCNSTRCTPIT